MKSCGLKPSDPNSGKMESIQIVLKLGEKGESDRQNLNMRVSFQNNMRCGGKRGGMGKNYAMIGSKANLQARYIGKTMKS